MLSSRNIHFVILGIIIGISAGYVLAFYQAQSADRRPQAQASGSQNLPANHPDFGGEEALSILKEAVDRNPRDPDALTRYGTALLKSERFEEAVELYQRVLEVDAGNLNVRSLLGTLLFTMGRVEEARKELDTAFKQDPRNVPTLHGMFLIALDADHDSKKAGEILKTIETLEPGYQGLATLRASLDDERKKAPR